MSIKIFLHIPKCGGSTVRDKIISRFKGEGRVLKIYSENPEKDYYSRDSFLRDFKSGLPDGVKSICGHISHSDIAPIISDKNCEIFSLVRDPIERVISNLNYMLINPGHSGHQSSLKVSEENFFDYLVGHNKSFQYDFLGGDDLIKNVKLYKLSSYKKALYDLGIIRSLTDDITIKNITKEKNKSSKQLFSFDMLTSSQVDTLVELYEKDYSLYKSAQ